MKTKLAVKAFAAVALAYAILAGCTEPGTATTVNGRPVSEQSVDELAQQLKESGLGKPLTAPGIDLSSRFRPLGFRVTITVVGPAVDKAGEKLDASQKDQILRQCKKGLNTSSELPSGVQRYCLAQALTSGQSAFQKEINGILADMKIEYSKQYGVADEQKGLELPGYLTLRRGWTALCAPSSSNASLNSSDGDDVGCDFSPEVPFISSRLGVADQDER